MNDKIYAGVSEIDITPPVGVEMAGYDGRKGAARGIHDRLKAISVVFTDGDQKACLCSLDAIGLPKSQVESAKRRLLQELNIHPSAILICATHTHSGPEFESGNPINKKWIFEFEDKIVESIRKAASSMVEVRIGCASGQVAGVGGNRREPKNGFVDRSVTVMKIESAETGKVISVILNYACHATTMDLHNLELSADYPGFARNYINENLPDKPVVMFLNGACGDINPGGYSAEDSALGKFIPKRTFERAAEIGRILGDETIRLLDDIKPQLANHICSKTAEVRLPLKRMKTPSEAKRDVESARVAHQGKLNDPGVSEEEKTKAALELLYANIRYSNAVKYSGKDVIICPVGGLAIGDIMFLGFPGELFAEIGYALKNESPFGRTFILGYVNASIGYFPTVDALKTCGGYEVLVSVFGLSSINLLQTSALSLMNEIFSEMRKRK